MQYKAALQSYSKGLKTPETNSRHLSVCEFAHTQRICDLT